MVLQPILVRRILLEGYSDMRLDVGVLEEMKYSDASDFGKVAFSSSFKPQITIHEPVLVKW